MSTIKIRFFCAYFSLQNEREKAVAGNRSAVRVVGLSPRVLGRIKSGFTLFAGQNMFWFSGG